MSWTPHIQLGLAIVAMAFATVVRVNPIGAALAGVGAMGCALACARSGRAASAFTLLCVGTLAAAWAWGTVRVTATATVPVAAPRHVSVEVVVETTATHAAGRQRARGRIRAVGTGEAPTGARILLEAPDDGPRLEPGHVLQVGGVLGPAASATDPHWWRRYLARQRVAGELRAESLRLIGRRGGVAGLRDRLRGRLTAAAGEGLDDNRRALVRGMALGGGGDLSASVAADMRAAGLWHLLAVSGQNIAFVAIGIDWIAALLGLGRRLARSTALIVVVAYCLMCDGGASVARAGIVGSLVIAGDLLERDRDRGYLTLLGLFALLAIQPRSIGDPGLQLSFAAVAGLGLIAPRLRVWLGGVLPAPLVPVVGSSVAASLATAPVAIANFGSVSTVGTLVNVVVAPIVGPVVVMALVGALLGALGIGLAAIPTILAGTGAASIAFVAHLGASIPGALRPVPMIWALAPALGAAAIPVAGWWLWRRPGPPPAPRLVRTVRRTLIATAAAIFALVLTRPGPAPWPPAPQLSMLDIGQGDAILLRSPDGAAVLVDTGPPGSPGSPAPVVDHLRRAGVDRLSALVLTHHQADHDGALDAVLDATAVREIVVPRLAGAAAPVTPAAGGRVVTAASGDRIAAGAWTLDVLWPPADLAVDDPNDGALVLRAQSPGMTALLTSDVEGDILRRLRLDTVDVLKVAHHGSEDPDLPTILARTRPQVALISVGSRNPFGHPRPGTLSTLRAAGVPVVRTDVAGTVAVTSVDGRIRVLADR